MRHPKLDTDPLAAGWEQLSLLTCVWLWVPWEGQDRHFRADAPPPDQMVIGREQGPSELAGEWG